ncbi:MAG TPA: S-layer homology domain-containing protein [Thermoanaerobaculia bacterium]
MKTSIRVSLGLALALWGGSVLGQTAETRKPLPKPKTYGVDPISYYRIAAAEFTPLTSSIVYEDASDPVFGVFQRYSTSNISGFVASPHLPSGALLTYFELDSCDQDPNLDVEAYLYACDDLGNCGSPTALKSSDNAIPCGYTSADVSGSGIQIDNYRNQVTVVVATRSGNFDTRFAGVILGYKLQVSPPPLFADFNDVPTDHPYFQFIEALVASSITAGCGNGDYCPDRAITRGEMAVFVAKALGLQWP